MILPGGHGDADTAKALCQQLVDRYTVVTYSALLTVTNCDLEQDDSDEGVSRTGLPPNVLTDRDPMLREAAKALTCWSNGH